jgi:hypothetical protein
MRLKKTGCREYILWLVVSVLALCFVPSATSQPVHGTIGVVYYTRDKIVVAAESRLVGGVGSTIAPTDDACKVAAVNGELVFVSSGMTRHVGDSRLSGWDNNDMIHEAYHRIKSKNPQAQGDLRGVAKEWSDSVADKFNADARLHPGLFPWLTSQMSAGEAFTIGYLGGRDETGNLSLFLIAVIPNASRTLAEGVAQSVGACRDHDFCSVGGAVDTVAEFGNASSERARKEWADWKPPKGTPRSDYDALKTIRILELAVLYHAGHDAGGPIDAVQLNRDGAIHWYARKPNCPEN